MAGKSDRDRSGILQLGPQWITAIAVLITALVGAGFFTGRATAPAGSAKPAPTITITVTASPATPSTSSTPSAAVYYHGLVGIGQNGRDFDSNPPGPGSPEAVFFYGYTNRYDLNTISSTGGFAVWMQGGTPTASDCKTWATTHLTSDVSNVVAGMQICFKTDQGRYGLLRVKPGTTGYELNALATVWGP
jgi:hypothetical protein